MFPPDCLFGGIPYEIYVDTIVQMGGLCLTHLQFANLLMSKEPDLLLQNLLLRICLEEDTTKLIAENNGITEEEARSVFSSITLDDKNKDYHKNSHSAAAPYIKVSNTQYLCSFHGCLGRPFEFMLAELKRRFPRDWDINTGLRESRFREQLYALFDEKKYIRINKNIVLKSAKKVITDIDACVMDTENGDIAFLQLKWQDLTYDSSKSLSSKRKNYYETTSKWVDDVLCWVESATTDEIARKLDVKQDRVDKSKIRLFVLGRFHGNYSGEKPRQDCVWGQWYSVLNLVAPGTPNMVAHLYNVLASYSPYNYPHIDRTARTHVFGDYTVRIG